MSEPLTMTEWFDHLDELLMDRLGIPSGSLAANIAAWEWSPAPGSSL